MGRDTFCPITGMHHFGSRNTILGGIWPNRTRLLRAVAGGTDSEPASKEVLAALQQGLGLSSRDVKSSSLMVMIGVTGEPTSTENLYPNPAPRNNLFCPGDCTCAKTPTHINETNIREVTNVRVWNDLSYDQYFDADEASQFGSEARMLEYHPEHGSGVAVNYSAYLILRHACPRLLPHMIYIMFQQCRPLGGMWHTLPPEINYGPVQHVIGQWPRWENLGQIEEDKDGEGEKPWDWILYQKKSVDEILEDAWGGEGAMWVTVRPNKFPIQEAAETGRLGTFPVNIPEDTKAPSSLEALPADLLLEICGYLTPREISPLLSVSKTLRGRIQPHLDSVIYRYIKTDMPWLLPAGPIRFDDKRFGREEVDRWIAEWCNWD